MSNIGFDIEPEENLDIIDYRVYKALIVGTILGVIVNVCYFLFFYFIDAIALSLINFFGIFVYSFSIFLVKKGHVKIPYVFIVIQIVVSCILSSFYLGSGSGFYYFILALLPITFLYSKWHVIEMFFVTLFVFIGYLLAAYFELYYIPILEIDKSIINGLLIGNIIGALLTIVSIFYSFNRSIKKIEETLLDANKTLTLNNEEKKVLLKEIHHRVKNNLHVVNSILEVQVLEIEDDKMKSYLQDAQRRIISMATIHEKMYGSDNLKYISASDYIESLVFDLQKIYDSDNKIKIELDFDEVQLDLDTIAPLAFLVNEIVTNSYKHAFKGTENPQIFGSLKVYGDRVALNLGDNGPGFKIDQDSGKSSLGLDLIDSFVNELEASCSKILDGGTEYRFVFDKKLIMPEIKEK